MIKGLFETHLYVENIDRSIHFYSEIIGLQECHYEKERKAAFFWIGETKKQMLGLWEQPKENIDIRHFAFECDAQWILNDSINWFKERNLPFKNFLKDRTERPMVFAWTPAISIYFDDPDGHSLEFIGLLDGKSRPDKGVISYEEWLELEKKDKKSI